MRQVQLSDRQSSFIYYLVHQGKFSQLSTVMAGYIWILWDVIKSRCGGEGGIRTPGTQNVQ